MKLTTMKLFVFLLSCILCYTASAQFKPGQLSADFNPPPITGTVVKTVDASPPSSEGSYGMFVLGNFTKVGTKSFGGIALLDDNGNLDDNFGTASSFKGAIGANDTIFDCAYYSNRFSDTLYLIVVGKFNSFNGDVNAKNIAIIDMKGKIAFDMSKFKFDNTIYGIERLSNGKYYLYGKFGPAQINLKTSQTSYITKLNDYSTFPKLSLDSTFQKSQIVFDAPINALGYDYYNSNVYVAGSFTKPQSYIYRFTDTPNGIFPDKTFPLFGVPNGIVRTIDINSYEYPNVHLYFSGDFSTWGSKTVPGIVKAEVNADTINARFKPTIGQGKIRSLAFDYSDSLLITGPFVVNGKSVGQLELLNPTTGASANLFFSRTGFNNGQTYHSRFKNGGFFVAGTFSLYDGTKVSKVAKINGSVSSSPYFYYNRISVCENDTFEISGYALGTTQSVKWGGKSLNYRVVDDYLLKVYIPKGMVTNSSISASDTIGLYTLYPTTYHDATRITIYKRPEVPVVSKIVNQSQTITLGQTGVPVGYKVSNNSKGIYDLNSIFKNGTAYTIRYPDSLGLYFYDKWVGKENLTLNYSYASQSVENCSSKDTSILISVLPLAKPSFVMTGKSKAQAGVLEQYKVVRKDTVAYNLTQDIVFDWFYVPKNDISSYSTKYFFLQSGEILSDSAMARFTFLSNTPDGYIVALASFESYDVDDNTIHIPFDTASIRFKIVGSSLLPTTCVDTLGCNDGFNITKVKIDNFKFDQKMYHIDCLGNGYSDFTADTFQYVNDLGESVVIPMERQTIYTSGRIRIKMESDIAQYYGVWIDLNNNNDFRDPYEFVYHTSSPSLENEAQIIIPNFENVVGDRRLRIRSSNEIVLDPCGLINQSTDIVEEKGETEDYVIKLAPYLTLQANQVITPNSDGKNDYLDIKGVDPSIQERKLIIYDRFGKKVYDNANYTESDRWSGLDQDGKQLESGTYYFYFKNGERTLKNFVEIVRDNN